MKKDRLYIKKFLAYRSIIINVYTRRVDLDFL